MRSIGRAAQFAAVALVLLGPLTACGDDGDDEESPASTTEQSEPGPADDAGSDDCGGVADTVAGRLTQPEVTEVTVVGQCTSLTIATSLDDSASDDAKVICDAAAEVGYVDDVSNISVIAQSGRELAIGIAGADCLAEP